MGADEDIIELDIELLKLEIELELLELAAGRNLAVDPTDTTAAGVIVVMATPLGKTLDTSRPRFKFKVDFKPRVTLSLLPPEAMVSTSPRLLLNDFEKKESFESRSLSTFLFVLPLIFMRIALSSMLLWLLLSKSNI